MLRAAGAVVWRGEESRPEVAVVHRPHYDDWTFPKGKVKTGEHLIAAALREVHEETGMTVSLGRALPPVHYLKAGRLKRVDYWAAQADPFAGFTANDEVDEMRWLPLERARELLSYEWDVGLLRALVAAPLSTVPLVLARHGTAGSRQDWADDDALRPLDPDGRAQAATLAEVLPAFRPELLLSSPSRRCVETLEPYADRAERQIGVEPMLSEEGQDPQKTPDLLRDLTVATVACSHGKVLPELIHALSGKDVHLRKGAFAVVHRLGRDVVSVERYAS
ncbi:NUDIX hydrolase [Nonomuraea sp. NN258]|nr:NUDIX hydrolase [Nonomuraea antri]